MLAQFNHLCSLRSLLNREFKVIAFLNCFRNFRSHSTVINMDKVYLRNTQDTDELLITFRYVNETLKLDRNFNFCRRMDECIDEAIIRIRNNVEREMTKRNKQKSKNSQSAEGAMPVNLGEIIVEFHREGSEDRILGITFAELLSDLKNGLKLRVVDTHFDVVLNQPWVGALQLSSSIMTGFLVYPVKLELEFASREHSLGEWYKTLKPPSGMFNDKTVWEPCGEGLIYKVSPEDVGHHLKFVIRPGNDNGLFGPPTECISNQPVLAGPTSCPFERRHQYTSQLVSGNNDMRVVSYNLLADLYADGDYARKVLFPYCAPEALNIDYRKQLFIKELIGYNADLLCLQEVDIKIFEYDLKPVLQQSPHYFHGLMAPKGNNAEGIALFYRSTRFQLINNYILNLGDNISTLPIFASLWNRIKNNEQLAKRICDLSTTLQLTLLQLKETGRYVLVANTHLYFHPDADHIRLLQIGFSLNFVEHIYRQTIREKNINTEDIGVIFCGDFNSVPECGIYKLMTEQFVGDDFIDWSSNKEETVKDVELRQIFHMSSACGAPPYTNYTTLFAACLDYIFYQGDRFELLQSVPTPTVEELSANVAIPSITFPSDHVALIADLSLKSNN